MNVNHSHAVSSVISFSPSYTVTPLGILAFDPKSIVAPSDAVIVEQVNVPVPNIANCAPLAKYISSAVTLTSLSTRKT